MPDTRLVLHVGQKQFQLAIVGLVQNRALSKRTFALSALAGQNMASKRLVINEFSASRSFEPLGSGTVGLDLGHIALLLEKICSLPPSLGDLKMKHRRPASAASAISLWCIAMQMPEIPATGCPRPLVIRQSPQKKIWRKGAYILRHRTGSWFVRGKLPESLRIRTVLLGYRRDGNGTNKRISVNDPF